MHFSFATKVDAWFLCIHRTQTHLSVMTSCLAGLFKFFTESFQNILCCKLQFHQYNYKLWKKRNQCECWPELLLVLNFTVIIFKRTSLLVDELRNETFPAEATRVKPREEEGGEEVGGWRVSWSARGRHSDRPADGESQRSRRFSPLALFIFLSRPPPHPSKSSVRICRPSAPGCVGV